MCCTFFYTSNTRVTSTKLLKELKFWRWIHRCVTQVRHHLSTTRTLKRTLCAKKNASLFSCLSRASQALTHFFFLFAKTKKDLFWGHSAVQTSIIQSNLYNYQNFKLANKALPSDSPYRLKPSASKGQLISEWLFDVLNFPKNQYKNLMNFCPTI